MQGISNHAVPMMTTPYKTAPISTQTSPSSTHTKRQTLGDPQIVEIMDISSDDLPQNCPQYMDHHCSQIQDTLCLSDIFRQAAIHWSQQEASVQAIDASRCARISLVSPNNLKSHFQDLVSFTSMFRRLDRADILPNANYSETLCQLEKTVNDLNRTIAGFCENTMENCSNVIYSCENDFPANEERAVQFNATCNKELLSSLSAVLKYITNLMVSSSPRTPTCVAKRMACVRATSEQKDVLYAFKETLRERIFNMSLSSDLQIQPECRLSRNLSSHANTSVLDMYNALLDTVAMLGSMNNSVPSQDDLIVNLENTTLPLIYGVLRKVTVDTNQLKVEGSPLLLAAQLENVVEPRELTGCLVARLSQVYPHTLRRLESLSILKTANFFCPSML